MSKRLEKEAMPRRDFLGLAGLWTAGAAVLGSFIGMARLPKPRVLPEADSRFKIGRTDELLPGTERLVAVRNVLVVSTPAGVAALSLICTHLGCVVSKTTTGFSCPCHGSKFGPGGEALSGPAPRALRWLEVSQAANGALIADAKREVKPGTYYKV